MDLMQKHTPRECHLTNRQSMFTFKSSYQSLHNIGQFSFLLIYLTNRQSMFTFKSSYKSLHNIGQFSFLLIFFFSHFVSPFHLLCIQNVRSLLHIQPKIMIKSEDNTLSCITGNKDKNVRLDMNALWWKHICKWLKFC